MGNRPKNQVREVLSSENLCTLSTVTSEGSPEAATIQFVADKEINLYFETFPSYRKYSNLKENPEAAVVVDEQQGKRNVQLEGKAIELTGKEAENTRNRLIEEYGEGTGYLQDENIKFFKFRPDWIRILLDPEYPPEYAMVRGDGDTELHEEEQ